jgi:hypothetical protein
MRIHGDVVINRRTGLEPVRDYHKYRQQLREDFKGICGYCGKPESISFRGFEIDHLIPDRIDSTLKHFYSNLVYSCFTCNRKKTGKWPLENSSRLNDGHKGFVDPADSVYDAHLGRNNDGEIEYYTEVGAYMANDVFHFNTRPIALISKLIVLQSKLDSLEEKINSMTQSSNPDSDGSSQSKKNERLQEYFNVNKLFRELMNAIYGKE